MFYNNSCITVHCLARFAAARKQPNLTSDTNVTTRRSQSTHSMNVSHNTLADGGSADEALGHCVVILTVDGSLLIEAIVVDNSNRM